MRSFIVLALLVAGGCTDAEWSRTFNYDTRHRVELYSGGQKVREWHATGKIESETNSDGYYFKAEETGGLVTVSGAVVITALKGHEM